MEIAKSWRKKFTPAGGRIVAGVAPKEREVLFWVADTGAGIDAASVAHLFDRFRPTDSADRRSTRLGLSICKGIVEAHGGRLWALPRATHGSMFKVVLPIGSS